MLNKLINKLKTDPFSLVKKLWYLFKGTVYILYYRIFTNVRIEFPLYAIYKLNITGPGQVTIKKNCVVAMNTFEGLNIVTFFPSSTVTIDEHCHLGGLTIRCAGNVSVGKRCLFAHSIIQDTNFINKPIPGSIIIKDNVWIATQAILLNKTVIGNNSVLGSGVICSEEVKADHLIMCNSKKQLSISTLMRFLNV